MAPVCKEVMDELEKYESSIGRLRLAATIITYRQNTI